MRLLSHEIPGYHNRQWSKFRAHELGNPKVPLNYHNIYIDICKEKLKLRKFQGPVVENIPSSP
jgi:hypothetical protein